MVVGHSDSQAGRIDAVLVDPDDGFCWNETGSVDVGQLDTGDIPGRSIIGASSAATQASHRTSGPSSISSAVPSGRNTWTLVDDQST